MFLRRQKKLFSELNFMEDWLLEGQTKDKISFLNPQYHLYSKELELHKLEDLILPDSNAKAPRLLHGLEKIVRTEGIYLADQFPEFVRNLPPINPEIHRRLSTYVPPSKDKGLVKYAEEQKVKYFTGSSSLTDNLQQIYYAVTNYKSPDVTGLGQGYNHLTMNYMSAYRKPNTFLLRKQDSGIYSIESDKGPNPPTSAEVLLMGGTILENLFTTEEKDFKRYIDLTTELSESDKNRILMSSKSFRYRKLGKMLIRSQIDCEAKDSEGETFVYEIKTRACAPIRYDVENYKDYLDYEILTRKGIEQSYEREHFDLIRSILIKYFFQIKIGRMDGAAVAYHNTQKTFGFEYISLTEIEKRIFGNSEISDQILKICLNVFQDILEDVTELFPDDNFLKVGIFSNFLTNELMITVENHKNAIEYPKSPEENRFIKSEVDYYNRYLPGKSALMLCRRFFPYINGILQKEPVFLEPGDIFALKQMKYVNGMMRFDDYMYFLLHAYKSDSVIKHHLFRGIWKKYNDFHVYRKPAYSLDD